MLKRLTFTCLTLLIYANSIYADNCHELGKILGGNASKVDKVCEIFVPRNGIVSKLGDFVLDPEIGIGLEVSVIPLEENGNKKAFDGEIALFQEEVQTATALFKDKEFDLIALHNHYLLEHPKIMYLHFEKQGDAEKITKQLREIIDLLGGFDAHRSHQITPSHLDAEVLNKILKLNGQIEPGGVFRADCQRPFKIEDNGAKSEPECVISIQGSMKDALVVGEIALKVHELQHFIKALLQNELTFTAEHNHEVSEQPRVYYIHFQKVGYPARELAKSVRQALDEAKISIEQSGE